MANAARLLSVDAIEQAKSGHPGMAMGIADIITVLAIEGLHINPAAPNWPNRDRLVLSAGHGVVVLYSMMYLLGFAQPKLEDIKRLRQIHSVVPGHPEFGTMPGIEATTGPLGQGIANAVGMAIAEKIMKERFGSELVNHKIFAIVGDGCMMEGISHEAASLAGHLGLDNLIVFFDSNRVTIDGATDLCNSENTSTRFRAYGWNVISINGHNFAEISAAIKLARSHKGKPTMIECHTIIAKGAFSKEGSNKSHGSQLGSSEVEQIKENIMWPHEPFVIPQVVLNMWRKAGTNFVDSYNAWQKIYESSPRRREFDEMLNGNLTKISLSALRDQLIAESPASSTRAISGRIIERMVQNSQFYIGGSADLTESNCTKGSNMTPITKDSFAGNYIHYGIREHAMAAVMNGMALYGGLVPYSGTFLVFSDYMRPSMRLSAMMELKVIYVLTHDSIGVGEDGPTHQPVEHLASLRAMPNMHVFRPGCASEVLATWELALNIQGPSSIVLTRQNVPAAFYNQADVEKGAYIVKESSPNPDVVIFATGSELHVAMASYEELVATHGVNVRVVSMFCWRLFDKQSEAYKNQLLSGGKVKVAIEAATRFGWDKYIGRDGIFIGVDDQFGLSGKADDLFNYFGITTDNVVKVVMDTLTK